VPSESGRRTSPRAPQRIRIKAPDQNSFWRKNPAREKFLKKIKNHRSEFSIQRSFQLFLLCSNHWINAQLGSAESLLTPLWYPRIAIVNREDFRDLQKIFTLPMRPASNKDWWRKQGASIPITIFSKAFFF